MNKPPIKEFSGFTFVEVSIAVAIVSLITVLAVSSLSSFRTDSREKKITATISNIEHAKNRYVLNTSFSVSNQPTTLTDIAPYLRVKGKEVASLFNLIEGTGKTTNDLDLGTYQGRVASFTNSTDNIENTEDQQEAVTAANALNSLNSGTPWNSLTTPEKTAVANTYPSQAVGFGGADALNQMNPTNLSPTIVSGYVNNAGTWTTPQLTNGVANNTTFTNMPANWSGWGTPLAVMRITNPIAPAELIGYLTPNRTPQFSVNFTLTGTNYPYNASLVPNIVGAVLTATPQVPTTSTIGGGGGGIFGGGTLGGGTLGGGLGGSAGSTPPGPTNVSSITNASSATFSSTIGGQIVIMSP